jgi:hypothetical protein
MIDNEELKILFGETSDGINKLLINASIDDAYFITPENPFSLALSDEENELRHGRFIKILEAMNYIYYVGYGADEDEKWGREKSYLIVSNDDKEMQQLATQFGQNAFLHYSVRKGADLMLIKPISYERILV